MGAPFNPQSLPLPRRSDCPQVQAIYDYKAAQPDELSLERGDVVKVYRKMADGESSNTIPFLCPYAKALFVNFRGSIQLLPEVKPKSVCQKMSTCLRETLLFHFVFPVHKPL